MPVSCQEGDHQMGFGSQSCPTIQLYRLGYWRKKCKEDHFADLYAR
jgi:hypothetical protein